MKKKNKNLFLIIILVFVVAFIYVWEQIESEKMLRRLNDIDKKKQEEMGIYSQLQMVCSDLRSPDRLNTIARKLKFVVPQKDKIIYINKNK